MNEFIKLVISILSVVGLIIVGIAGMVLISSALFQTEIIVQSWTALFLFAFGTFLWIVPLQVIDWMKLIPVQRRLRRIIYPYFITFIQIVFFAVYMIGLNVTISDVVFTNMGLISFISVIVFVANLVYSQFVRYIRKYKKARVHISA
ncbi:hypothetical protein [Salipaludibacillus keqinensis]|nr:hypothetical protein [Salipaludibacillus keqinensis]